MFKRKNETVILDCYTDEPSGFGVRPYLGTHQIHLSQALSYLGIDHFYLTIDDLRYCMHGDGGDNENTDLRIFNRTRNCNNAINILQEAKTIYIFMGCFVDYQYFSCVPPNSDEVFDYLKRVEGRKILFYVLGASNEIAPDYRASPLRTIIDEIEHGNAYRYLLEKNNQGDRSKFLSPNYDLLDIICTSPAPIITQLRFPVIAEIETGTGCNTPFCVFCIESLRALELAYREADSVVKQVATLNRMGIRHFRLGRQPNFYHYQYQNLDQMKRLLAGIRENCPNIETLHIDNANPVNVVSDRGRKISKLIVDYCTSGNLVSLGIESFDDTVRQATQITGKAKHALKAIEIINEYGGVRGPDGLPKFLPGINLIYGLPGQTIQTQQINLRHLNEILECEWMTRRLFFRRMTRPTGISFSRGPTASEQYKEWFDEIIERFVLPMQTLVYPSGTILRNHREVILKEGDSYLRTLGTCPIRVVVKNKQLEAYGSYDLQVTNNLDYRLLEGKVINETS